MLTVLIVLSLLVYFNIVSKRYMRRKTKEMEERINKMLQGHKEYLSKLENKLKKRVRRSGR